jgi:hypothetical protein
MHIRGFFDFDEARGLTIASRVILIALTIAFTARASLRPTADRRAIQWSDAIVHAKLGRIVDSANNVYSFTITDAIDGSLKPADQITVRDLQAPSADSPPAPPLTTDDLRKNFRLLLRQKPDHTYIAVNIAPSDPSDTEGSDAFKQLVEETRKADASLTDDQIKTQALAYANAQDDTEAEQAQDALEQMGPKAVPVIREAMTGVNDIGKQRLETVIKDLTPPGEDEPTTQPSK